MPSLEEVAKALVVPGKGILAADESGGTIRKRFDSISLESTETNRRDYREMLFTAGGAEQYVSGVILFDETIRQQAADGTPLVKILTDRGIIPGIKVDKGAKPLALHEGETVTEGLDGLAGRMKEYGALGARFAKWRGVYKIGEDRPSAACITANAHALARYAAICQEAGIVPIVEPEVLMDGDHDIEICEYVTEEVLRAVFSELSIAEVQLEGMLLKPNMVISGSDCPNQAGHREVAERTVACCRRAVPAAVPGIVFLSGGQSDENATLNLNAMNRLGGNPWALSFSYGRALQAASLKAWSGPGPTALRRWASTPPKEDDRNAVCRKGSGTEAPPASRRRVRTMVVKVGINGFGRIGRLVFRAAMEAKRDDVAFAAINDLGSAEANAHLLTYDSVHGRFPGTVEATEACIVVNGNKVAVLSERDPTKLPWGDLGVDIVMECTGIFASRDKAAQHLEGGAKRVIVSAPAAGADLTVVYGVNHDRLTADHVVISNASCTTNCLAPVAHALHRTVGIERGFMTTIHSYTGDQRTVDTLHKDLARARAAAISIVPTTTGAARAVGLVLPELQGKLDGTAMRVPTPNVSLIDFKFDAARETHREEINAAIEAAAAGPLKGVLDTNALPLVSCDYNHNPASSIFDLKETQVIEGRFVRVMSWYDNEWGFSNRMSDTAVAMSATL
ncbi:MAG: fructose-bisphosphate aldolase class I [Rhodospirillales bacterium]|nr:fructose-bisphosphate aldolase class I [Rhodospirillales bacterium]